MAIEPRARRESGLGCDPPTHARSKLGPIISARSPHRSRRLVLLHLFGQQISIPRRPQGRKQPVAREPVKETWRFQVAVIAPQETNNRAFGLLRAAGARIEASRTKISSGAGSIAAREPRGKCGSICRPAVVEKSKIRRCQVRTGFPAASVTLASMVKRPSRTTDRWRSRPPSGLLRNRGISQRRECPPTAPQIPRTIMPAIKAVRCGLNRFTTFHVP